MGDYFSISRWLGIVGKEFIQLKRDRLTFGMIVGIPIIQLTLFGFAINSDPKHLPTAALIADRSEFSRDILAALRNRMPRIFPSTSSIVRPVLPSPSVRARYVSFSRPPRALLLADPEPQLRLDARDRHAA